MKINLFFIGLIGLCSIQGCSGYANVSGRGGKWVHAYPSSIITQLPEVTGYEKNYKIGEEKTIFVGQEIIHVKTYTKKQHMYFREATSQHDVAVDTAYIEDYKLRVKKNDKFSITGKIEIDGKMFHMIQLPDYDKMWGLLVDDEGYILTTGIFNYYYGRMYYPQSIIIIPKDIKFSLEKNIVDISYTTGASYDLIYSGKNDISLNVSYREYFDNLARPSFFQNLTYQANAKQIRFRDFVIQIHDMSDEKITFTILEDGMK